MQDRRKECVVLLSGGLDSAVALRLAQVGGYEPVALTVDYGQVNRRELDQAARICERAGVRQKRAVVRMDEWGTARVMSFTSLAYIPMRNTVLLALAAAEAVMLGAEAVVIGANKGDAEGFPDCRPAYLGRMEEVISLGLPPDIEVFLWAPLVQMTKTQVVQAAVRQGVETRLTWSCYRNEVRPCGECEACLKRAWAFREAGEEDPAEHQYLDEWERTERPR